MHGEMLDVDVQAGQTDAMNRAVRSVLDDPAQARLEPFLQLESLPVEEQIVALGPNGPEQAVGSDFVHLRLAAVHAAS